MCGHRSTTTSGRRRNDVTKIYVHITSRVEILFSRIIDTVLVAAGSGAVARTEVATVPVACRARAGSRESYDSLAGSCYV